MININSAHPYFYIIASIEWVGAAFSLSDGVGLRTLPSQPILVGAVSVGTSNEKKGNFQTNWNRCLYIVKLCEVPASRNGEHGEAPWPERDPVL